MWLGDGCFVTGFVINIVIVVVVVVVVFVVVVVVVAGDYNMRFITPVSKLAFLVLLSHSPTTHIIIATVQTTKSRRPIGLDRAVTSHWTRYASRRPYIGGVTERLRHSCLIQPPISNRYAHTGVLKSTLTQHDTFQGLSDYTRNHEAGCLQKTPVRRAVLGEHVARCLRRVHRYIHADVRPVCAAPHMGHAWSRGSRTDRSRHGLHSVHDGVDFRWLQRWTHESGSDVQHGHQCKDNHRQR